VGFERLVWNYGCWSLVWFIIRLMIMCNLCVCVWLMSLVKLGRVLNFGSIE